MIIGNTLTENQTYSVGGITGPATKIEVSMTGEPNNHVSKTYVGASGWMEGLPLATEDWANENGSTTPTQRRWTTTDWTQDNINLSYILNPRVTQSKVGDTSNTKRTTVGYITQSGITLPSEAAVYDTNQTTVLKRSLTEYNWSATYLSRRIIGLPIKSEAYGSNQSNNQFEMVSEVTYGYDEGDFSDTTLNQNISSVIQHDNTNYGANLIAGRGNLTSTTRHDVTGLTAGITSSVLYNTAGAPVKQTTPGSAPGTTRQVKVDYADKFNDNGNGRNTFAYPTKITDPADKFSEVRYRYDTGANVRAQSPAPQNQQIGKTSERIFDSFGRLERQTIVNNGGAYTRYEYPASGVQSKVYSTITDSNDNGADAADEVLSESWADGAGRVRRSRTELPNSTGGWSGTLVEYDVLGQVKKQSTPTEVNLSWTPSGDDQTRGWLWTSNEYDWKGRVTRTINTDGTDKLVSYDGCGCAGGQVTTVKGENIVESDWQNNNQTTLGRRTQKIYADILGRTKKTEVMNWDGATPYTTTINKFDGRDQIASTRRYAGAEGGSTYQETTATYDGHGRVKTRHRPEQAANTASVYNYNPDDSIQSVVDARGASINYSYNSRGLVEQISSTVPSGSSVAATPTVTFGYDSIGNRISMQDGLGSVGYAYNQLSQSTAETRTFADALSNAPQSGNGFKIEYDYTLSGQLKSYTDPYGQQINYTQDKVGRMLSVSGATAFANVTDYANNAEYRAWGDLKKLSFGNGLHQETTYNNQLRASNFQLKKADNQAVMNKTYDYYADANLRKLDDALENKFDRVNRYDQAGRILESKAGTLARGEASTAYTDKPYAQTYNYDTFGQIGGRTGSFWNSSYNYGYTFQNGRVTGQSRFGTPNAAIAWQYDAEGNALVSYDEDYRRSEQAFGAAGETTKTTDYVGATAQSETTQYNDGDGREAKRAQRVFDAPTNAWTDKPARYYEVV